ncbi:MAG: hypothetical protein HKN27_08350, partial [Silicimonas sp.]|nr:hypothetical protein [Silicimonas sp.]
PYGMDISDYFYFLIPIQVSFKTVIMDPACGGTHAAGATAMGMSARRMGAQQSDRIDQVERQVNEEEREAEEARQRALQEMMLEWGPPFTHEGGLLEEDQEPEEDEGDNDDPAPNEDEDH